MQPCSPTEGLVAGQTAPGQTPGHFVISSPGCAKGGPVDLPLPTLAREASPPALRLCCRPAGDGAGPQVGLDKGRRDPPRPPAAPRPWRGQQAAVPTLGRGHLCDAARVQCSVGKLGMSSQCCRLLWAQHLLGGVQAPNGEFPVAAGARDPESELQAAQVILSVLEVQVQKGLTELGSRCLGPDSV